MLQPYEINPGVTLDFEFSWAAWLAPDSDTISTFDAMGGAGFSVGAATHEAGIVKVFVTTATLLAPGSTGSIRCDIVTAAGRHDSRQINFLVKRF